MDKLIHKLIFQDGYEPIELPERPTFDDFREGVRQFVNLTNEQQRAYSAALHEYESRRKEYLYETKLITAARTAITESISTAKLTSLREGDTLRQWLQKLEASTAPSRGFMTDRIRKQYSSHLRASTKTNLLDWLTKWEEIIEEADLYFLTEALTGQWLRDIASVIRPLSDGYATVFYEDSRRIDEEAATAQYRVYQALRPDSIGSTPTLAAVPPSSTHWTFQLVARKIREIAEQQPQQQKGGIKRGAGFLADKEADEKDPSEERPKKKRKGKKPDSDKNTEKSDKKRCPACTLKGHDLPDCWAIFEEDRPDWCSKNEDLTRKAQQALENSLDLRKKVEKIRHEKEA